MMIFCFRCSLRFPSTSIRVYFQSLVAEAENKFSAPSSLVSPPGQELRGHDRLVIREHEASDHLHPQHRGPGGLRVTTQLTRTGTDLVMTVIGQFAIMNKGR